MHDSNSIKSGRGEMAVCYCDFLTHEVVWCHLNSTDKFKVNTVKPKATTQRVTANNLTKEIKWNNKKYLINPRKGRKRRKLGKE